MALVSESLYAKVGATINCIKLTPSFVLPQSMLLSGPPLGRQSTPVAA